MNRPLTFVFDLDLSITYTFDLYAVYFTCRKYTLLCEVKVLMDRFYYNLEHTLLKTYEKKHQETYDGKCKTLEETRNGRSYITSAS